MELEFLIKNKENAQLIVNKIEALKSEKKTFDGKKYTIDDFIKQYDIRGHTVMDKAKRLDKLVKKEGGERLQPVSRLPVSFQKIITSRAVSFLLGNPITYDTAFEEGSLDEKFALILEKINEELKLDYLNKNICSKWMSETEVAELFFWDDANEYYWSGLDINTKNKRPRLMILSKSNGDILHPIYNSFDDLVAFGREYTLLDDETDKEIQRLDVYTDKNVIKYQRATNGWSYIEEKPHGFEKIPIIYYKRDWPEWFDVQEIIERFETRLSNFADTNDYFGDPIILAKGNIVGFADKGESGKLLQLEGDATASYLTWEHAPESTKLELETLINLIYSLTQTPDISFDSVKGIGNITGIALKLLFIDAHLKAKDNEGVFGQGIQRRINFLKHAVSMLDVRYKPLQGMYYKPVFEPFMPENLKELIETLASATGGEAVMSQETALMHNPLVSDVEIEKERLREQGVGGME